MMHFNYQLNDGREIWVCEACKRSHMDLILARTWKLIGRKAEESACEHTTCVCVASPIVADLCTHH